MSMLDPAARRQGAKQILASIRDGSVCSDQHHRNVVAVLFGRSVGYSRALVARRMNVRPGIGIAACLLVVGAGVLCLWIGFSGLLSPDPAGGLTRTLGGFVGFFLLYLATIAAMQRS